MRLQSWGRTIQILVGRADRETAEQLKPEKRTSYGTERRNRPNEEVISSAPLLFCGDVLKKCALLALHIISEEGRDGDGFQVPGLGDEWKMGCPKSPMWESEVGAWSEDEGASSTASRQGNVCNDALHVVGLHGPSDKISLFLQDWELGTKLSHGPGNARKCTRPGRCCGCQMSLVLKKGEGNK